MDVSLITCTADRPAAFACCERWVHRMVETAYDQRPELRVEWIVSDGGERRAEFAERRVEGQKPSFLPVVHLRNRCGGPPACNFRRNLTAGLQAARGDVVLFIEDDDWYHGRWLLEAIELLAGVEIAGEGRARYYNLQTRRWKVMPNRQHASLCQTAIRRSLVEPLLRTISRTRSTFLDVRLWRDAPSDESTLRLGSFHSVGLKGFPGRPGIGVGHRMRGGRVDADGTVLRDWIGKDADGLLDLFRFSNPAQR